MGDRMSNDRGDLRRPVTVRAVRPKVFCITTVDISLRFLVLEFIKYLLAKGYQVIGACADGQYIGELEEAGVPVRIVPMTRRVTPLRDLICLLKLIRLLCVEKPDILHTHTPKANLLGQLAGWVTGIRVRLSTVHGFYFTRNTPRFKRLFFQVIELLSARCAHLVFLVNREDMDTAIRLRICRSEQLRLIVGGMGIDIERFRPRPLEEEVLSQKRHDLGLPSDAITIGFVGRLVREKGLLELFEAFRALYADLPNLWLLVVGPHDSEKADRVSPTISKNYGISDRCIFTGRVPDILEMYSAMDIFVLPSHREGMPLAVLEAQAMGIPVITSDARGCRESIVPGRTGMIVPVGDSGALAEAIKKLANDRELRRHMGEVGAQLVRERFDQQLVFSTYENEYLRQLRRRGFPLFDQAPGQWSP